MELPTCKWQHKSIKLRWLTTFDFLTTRDVWYERKMKILNTEDGQRARQSILSQKPEGEQDVSRQDIDGVIGYGDVVSSSV